MELTKNDYKYIQTRLDKETKEIFQNIWKKYGKYIKNKEKLKVIEDRFNSISEICGIVVVDEPNEDDIKQQTDNIPPAHSGRGKGDGKIHVYPHSKIFKDANSVDNIIKIYVEEMVPHEVFHYYIQPDLYDKDDIEKHGDDAWLGHKLTEGLVETYTQKYMKENNLGNSQTGYLEELILVDEIINDLKGQNKSDEEIDNILMNCNQIEIFDNCINGEYIKNKYICKHKVHEKIDDILKKISFNDKERYTDFEYLYRFLTEYYRNKNLDTTEIEEIFSKYNEKYSDREASKQK